MFPWRKILLYPIGVVYHLITATRNKLYDIKIKKSTSFNLPIICIGNLAVGGTGKTPHTEYLIRLLQNNFTIATLSRGYGRKTNHYLEASIKSSSVEVGDEPSQYKRKFPNLTVAVENKRVFGVQEILKNHPKTNLILLDDAFQHRAIKAGLNIVITDYNTPLANDYLLPAGNLRESKHGINRANIIIVSKCPKDLSEKEQQSIKDKLKFHSLESIYFTTINYGKVYNIFNNKELINTYHAIDIILVTGIGKPELLQKYTKSKFKSVSPLIYSDHHEFSKGDIKTIINTFNNLKSEQKIILTTEKDASRLLTVSELKNIPIYCIEIEVAFLNKKDKFITQIETYVRTNKTNG